MNRFRNNDIDRRILKARLDREKKLFIKELIGTLAIVAVLGFFAFCWSILGN